MQQISPTKVFINFASQLNDQSQTQDLYLGQKLIDKESITAKFELKVEEVNSLTIKDILKNSFPIMFSGSKGYGKSILAKKVQQEIQKQYQENQVVPIFLSAENIQLQVTTIFSQQKIRMLEDDNKMCVVFLIDDFEIILSQNLGFLENLKHTLQKISTKFIYFANTSILNHQIFNDWIQQESQKGLSQFEIIKFSKNEIKSYFEKFLPWEQYISNIDLSLKVNNNILKSIVKNIGNQQNIHNVLAKIIKLSSIVDNLEQEAGNAMTILKELKYIIKYQDFSLIRLKNSNFSYMAFHSCNFEASQMEYVDISKCWFIDCNLNNICWKNMVKNGTQLQLTKEVKQYDFLNDNQFVAVMFQTQDIELWHIKAAKRISFFGKSNFNSGTHFTFSQNGKYFTSYSLNKFSFCCKQQFKIQSGQSGKVIRQVGPAFLSCPIKFSFFNCYLAFSSGETIHLWNFNENKKLEEFKSSKGIQEIQFSSDDKLIASCSDDNTICLWNIAEKKMQLTTKRYKERAQFYKFSPDLKYIAFAFQKYIIIQDIVFGAEAGKFSRNSSIRNITIQFSNNCKFLAYAERCGTLTILAQEAQQKQGCQNFQMIENLNNKFQQCCKYVLSLNFFQPGNNLISGNNAGEIHFHCKIEAIDVINNQISYAAFAFSPSGKILALGSSENESVFIWDITQGIFLFDLVAQTDKVGCVNLIKFPLISNEDILIYSFNNHIKLWNIKLKQLISEYKYEKQLVEVFVLSPKIIEVWCQDQSVILIWAAETSSLELKLEINTQLSFLKQIAFSPNNNLLATCGDRSIQFWDSSSGEKKRQINFSSQIIEKIAFNPNGTILAFSGEISPKGCQQKITLWDVSEAQVIQTIEHDHFSVSQIKFSPKGEFLISGMKDSTIKIWNIKQYQDNKNPIVLQLHNQAVSFLDFSSDGTMLGAISFAGDLKVWSIKMDGDISRFQQNFQDNYQIMPYYSFTRNFDLNAEGTSLKNSQIVSDKGVNLLSLFLQTGGYR